MAPGRSIDTFPLAHLTHATPYQRFRFDGEVREFCEQDAVTHKNNLRVAKCIFVGDIAVGKTCVINRFGYGIFTNNYKATIGVDFDVQKFSILNLPFTLQVSFLSTSCSSIFILPLYNRQHTLDLGHGRARALQVHRHYLLSGRAYGSDCVRHVKCVVSGKCQEMAARSFGQQPAEVAPRLPGGKQEGTAL